MTSPLHTGPLCALLVALRRPTISETDFRPRFPGRMEAAPEGDKEWHPRWTYYFGWMAAWMARLRHPSSLLRRTQRGHCTCLCPRPYTNNGTRHGHAHRPYTLQSILAHQFIESARTPGCPASTTAQGLTGQLDPSKYRAQVLDRTQYATEQPGILMMSWHMHLECCP